MICPPPPASDEFVRALLSDHEQATRYLPVFYKGPQGWSLSDAIARREFQTKQHAQGDGWFTVMKLKNSYVGIVGLRAVSWDNKSGEMGITIHPKYWRTGLGVEAHHAVLKHSFEVLGLHRIEFMTDSLNKPMRAFYSKFGIQFEGIRRDCVVVPSRDKQGKFDGS